MKRLIPTPLRSGSLLHISDIHTAPLFSGSCIWVHTCASFNFANFEGPYTLSNCAGNVSYTFSHSRFFWSFGFSTEAGAPVGAGAAAMAKSGQWSSAIRNRGEYTSEWEAWCSRADFGNIRLQLETGYLLLADVALLAHMQFLETYCT